MSKPDKPEVPAHEIIAQQHQIVMGGKGDGIVKKVGDSFVSNNKRDRVTGKRSKASADVAVATRNAQKGRRGNVSKQVKAVSSIASSSSMVKTSSGSEGVMRKGQKLSGGARSAVSQSQQVTQGAMGIANIENSRNMDTMRRKFKKANSTVDMIGAAAGAGMGKYQGTKKANKKKYNAAVEEGSEDYMDNQDMGKMFTSSFG
jgi:hypothetical protein